MRRKRGAGSRRKQEDVGNEGRCRKQHRTVLSFCTQFLKVQYPAAAAAAGRMVIMITNANANYGCMLQNRSMFDEIPGLRLSYPHWNFLGVCVYEMLKMSTFVGSPVSDSGALRL